MNYHLFVLDKLFFYKYLLNFNFLIKNIYTFYFFSKKINDNPSKNLYFIIKLIKTIYK